MVNASRLTWFRGSAWTACGSYSATGPLGLIRLQWPVEVGPDWHYLEKKDLFPLIGKEWENRKLEK